MNLYETLAERLDPGGGGISDEEWREQSQAWMDRAVAALGSRDAWIDWIQHRVMYHYRVHWRETVHWTSRPGDPRVDGTTQDIATWMRQVQGYVWDQITAGVTPEQAVAEGPSHADFEDVAYRDLYALLRTGPEAGPWSH